MEVETNRKLSKDFKSLPKIYTNFNKASRGANYSVNTPI